VQEALVVQMTSLLYYILWEIKGEKNRFDLKRFEIELLCFEFRCTLGTTQTLVQQDRDQRNTPHVSPELCWSCAD
jgi:hypothetical protein